jgi:hypothetical protein
MIIRIYLCKEGWLLVLALTRVYIALPQTIICHFEIRHVCHFSTVNLEGWNLLLFLRVEGGLIINCVYILELILLRGSQLKFVIAELILIWGRPRWLRSFNTINHIWYHVWKLSCCINFFKILFKNWPYTIIESLLSLLLIAIT